MKREDDAARFAGGGNVKSSGFMLYHDDMETLSRLPGDAFKAVIIELDRISQGEEHKELEYGAEFVFLFMAKKIQRDSERYEERCKKNQDKIKHYWEKRKQEQAHSTENNSIPQNTDVNQQDITSNCNYNSNCNSNHKDIGVGEKHKRFSPPTPDEVNKYSRENGYAVDGQRFCDFYASKGWRVGNTPMKDWQAAVRTWASKQKQETRTEAAKSGRYYDYEHAYKEGECL